MRTAHSTVLAAGLMLAGCTAPVATEAPRTSVPEAVVALAAPYQDVATGRVRPEDGCYWYLHAGPVETTLLPLRTPQGNRICTEASETAGA